MASHPTVLRSPLATIVRAMLDVLAKYPSVPRWRVKLWRDGPELPPLADDGPDIVVQVGGLAPDEPIVIGAGRTDTRLTRHVKVTVRTRCEADEVSADPIRLLDDTIGHYAQEEAVIDALQMFDPADTQGNQLLVQPMRLIPSAAAERVQRAGNWTTSTLVIEMVYEASLNQSRQ